MKRAKIDFDLSDILRRTRAHGGTNGQFYGQCPAHEDKTESLSILQNDEGIFFNCHAGCTYTAIMNSLGIATKVVPMRTQSKPVASYRYVNIKGELLYTKYRYEPKTFRTQAHNGSWSLKGIDPVLYRRLELDDAIADGKTILLCEGEKDVEAARPLEPYGFLATTNHEGATGWKSEYNSMLKGADIIFVEDNDEKGRERTEKLQRVLHGIAAKMRKVSFPELPEKGDLFDYVEKFGVQAMLTRLNEATELGAPETPNAPWIGADEKDRASAKDYIDFIKSLPNIERLERCAITGELMAEVEATGTWRPAENLLRYAQSHARDFGKFFTLSAFEDHIERFRIDEAKPRLLIDMPLWDGVDRIAQQAECFKFKNLTQSDFHQLALHWGTTIFRRLKDPGIQPITPIIQGAQGLGKDSLVQSWIGGLGQYARELTIDSNNSVEALKQLHAGLAFYIGEFDRTAKSDIAALKHLLTTPFTDVRLPYEKASEKRVVRASFIATCNIADILVDTTGNRRFWVWEAEDLGMTRAKPYPGLWKSPEVDKERAQICAQFFALAEQGWKVDQGAYDRCCEYTATLTPEDPMLSMLEQWDHEIGKLSVAPAAYSATDEAPLYRAVDVNDALVTLAKEYGRSKTKIQQLLGLYHRRERRETARMYRAGMREVKPDDLTF